MEKRLNSPMLLPLEEIALQKVVVTLWKQLDILALFELGSYKLPSIRDRKLRAQQIEGERIIKSGLSKLELPELLLKKVTCLLKSVGLEITEWTIFNSELLLEYVYSSMKCFQFDSNLDRRVLAKLCFTSLGTIDYRKTAEELICHNMLDNVQKYKLACFYCLDAHIPRLWENLSEESKCWFCDEDEMKRGWMHLEYCWPHILKGEKSKLDNIFGEETPFYQRAFEMSACEFNEAATRYFYEKLTPEERENLLFKTARAVAERLIFVLNISFPLPEGNFPSTLRYLLIQMSHEQQMELLKEFPAQVLGCFLQWPWHNLLLDMVELTWTFLPVNCFYTLLWHLYENKLLGRSNLELVWNFFLRSPSNHKSYFIDIECIRGHFFKKFVTAEDTETIGLILRNVDAVDKERFVVSNQGLQLCHQLITEDKWPLVKLFVQESMLSKEDSEALKENYKQHILENSEEKVESRIQELERLFELANESHNGASCKRSSEGEKGCEIKKLCNED